MQTTKFRTLELALEFHKLAERAKAKNYIQSQLERASLSVVLNLQEGAAKQSAADQRRFYTIAYGSIRECIAIARVLNRPDLHEQADKIGAHVFKLMKSR